MWEELASIHRAGLTAHIWVPQISGTDEATVIAGVGGQRAVKRFVRECIPEADGKRVRWREVNDDVIVFEVWEGEE